jgi:2-phosphoglycerate kinase
LLPLGPNSLRCATKDKKDVVLNGVFFCPIFLFTSILMNQNTCQFIFYKYHILNHYKSRFLSSISSILCFYMVNKTM